MMFLLLAQIGSSELVDQQRQVDINGVTDT
jgi:hypothetical protein